MENSPFSILCSKLAYLQVDHEKVGKKDISQETTPMLYTQYQETTALGEKMILTLLRILKKGEAHYSSDIPPDFTPKTMRAISLYHEVLVPREPFWGMCFCLHAERAGDTYEKNLFESKLNLVYIDILGKSYLSEERIENLNIESLRFVEYSKRANDIFDEISKIETKGGEKVREKARLSLLASTESIEFFVKNNFGFFEKEEDPMSLRVEALRRIRIATSILNTISSNVGASLNDSSGMNNNSAENKPRVLGRRTLVKVQSSLQEILNTAMTQGSQRAKASLNELEDLDNNLVLLREESLKIFQQLEENLHRFQLQEEKNRKNEECEMVLMDLKSKIKDSLKRWQTVKATCRMREVAVIEEDVAPPPSSSGLSSLAPTGLLPGSNGDPQRLLVNTGKTIGSIGINVAKGGAKVVTGAKDAVTLVAGDVKNLATTSANKAMNVGSKAKELLRLDELGNNLSLPGKSSNTNPSSSASSVSSSNNNSNEGGGVLEFPKQLFGNSTPSKSTKTKSFLDHF